MRLFSSPQRQLVLSGLFLALVGTLWAVDMPAPIGAVIKDFFRQMTNRDGVVIANLKGESATVISVNRTEIAGLRIEILNPAGTASMVVTSPSCDYWQNDNRMTTRNTVTITRPDMEMTAQTMEWEFNKQMGNLRQNVRVVLKGVHLSPDPVKTANAK